MQNSVEASIKNIQETPQPPINTGEHAVCGKALFSVAPMMGLTDRHARYFFRQLSAQALLYTEMVTTGALLHGDASRYLRYHPQEHPIALQLGGSDPEPLAQCVRLAETFGYDEVNLNVGCPSPRVYRGAIGACLMAEPDRVAHCIAAMQDASRSAQITIKHRIGISSAKLGDLTGYDRLAHFVDTIAQTGCRRFIVHARTALLDGLSPKQNRSVPPLCYDQVYRLKQDFPHLRIVINGGIETLSEAKGHLKAVDGVMIGRAAYQNPWMLSEVDALLYGAPDAATRSREQVVEALYPYIEQEQQQGTKLAQITRHILNVFREQSGSRRFRRYLSEHAHRAHADLEVLKQAMRCLRD